jgi:hypothetical protein
MSHYVRDNYSVLLNMAPIYHIVIVHVIWTSWAHEWRLRFCSLRMGYYTRLLVAGFIKDVQHPD